MPLDFCAKSHIIKIRKFAWFMDITITTHEGPPM